MRRPAHPQLLTEGGTSAGFDVRPAVADRRAELASGLTEGPDPVMLAPPRPTRSASATLMASVPPQGGREDEAPVDHPDEGVR
jgi:hypothetical protein